MERTVDTPGAVALRVENEFGRVDVSTSDRPVTEITVEALGSGAEALVDATDIDVAETGGERRIVVRVPKWQRAAGRSLLAGVGVLLHGGQVGVAVRVLMPAGNSLEAISATADITAEGTYSRLEVRTATGDVRAGTVTGTARVRTASGDVRVDATGSDGGVETASGDVSVGEAPGPLSVNTASGDVTVRLVRAGCRLQTATGDVRVDRVGGGEVTLRTASGDVSAGIARGRPVHVDAQTVSGDVSSEIPLGDDEADEEPAGGGGELAVLDGELVDLTARSVSGDIRVSRAAALP